MMWQRYAVVFGLSLALASCGGAPPAPSGEPAPDGGLPSPSGPVTGSTLPAQMVGGWLYGTLSSTEYYDPGSDKWMDASGASEIVKYAPDGHYERTRLLTIRTYNCESKLFIHEQGVVRLEGDRLTYLPASGVNKGYSCPPSNSWNTNQIKSESWTLSFEQGGAGQDVMVLTDGGAVAHYGRYQP